MPVLTNARAIPTFADLVGQPLRTQSCLFDIRRYFYAAAGIQQQGCRTVLKHARSNRPLYTYTGSARAANSLAVLPDLHGPVAHRCRHWPNVKCIAAACWWRGINGNGVLLLSAIKGRYAAGRSIEIVVCARRPALIPSGGRDTREGGGGVCVGPSLGTRCVYNELSAVGLVLTHFSSSFAVCILPRLTRTSHIFAALSHFNSPHLAPLILHLFSSSYPHTPIPIPK